MPLIRLSMPKRSNLKKTKLKVRLKEKKRKNLKRKTRRPKTLSWTGSLSKISRKVTKMTWRTLATVVTLTKRRLTRAAKRISRRRRRRPLPSRLKSGNGHEWRSSTRWRRKLALGGKSRKFQNLDLFLVCPSSVFLSFEKYQNSFLSCFHLITLGLR